MGFFFFFFNLISISIKNKTWMDILWRPSPSQSVPFLWKATKHYQILQDSGFSCTPIKLSYVSASVIQTYFLDIHYFRSSSYSRFNH